MLHTGQSHSKTQKNSKSWLFWVFIIVSIPLAVLLVSYSAGYRFDRTTGSIIETSAVAIHTLPKQADIYLNGELQADSTPFIEILDPGSYTIEVKKEGYFDWRKEMIIEPGESLLFPEITLLKNAEAVEVSVLPEELPTKIRELTEDEVATLTDLGWSNAESMRLYAEEGKILILIDETTNTSYAVDSLAALGSDDEVRIQSAITDAEWIDNTLLFTDGYDLTLYYAKENNSELLHRQSSTIVDIAWHPNGSLLFYSDTDGIHALEMDNRDTRQRWTLSEQTNAGQLLVQERERELTYNVDGTQYELILRDKN